MEFGKEGIGDATVANPGQGITVGVVSGNLRTCTFAVVCENGTSPVWLLPSLNL